MQTINSNLASFISTAALRQLERKYADPKTPIQGLVLLGIQTQLDANNGRHSKDAIIDAKEETIESMAAEIEDLEKQAEQAKSEIEELEKNQK